MISSVGYKILSLLVENKGLASGAVLSENCNLSINTIRSEIGKLNEELEDYDCYITSHIANGYRLVVSDENKLNDMMKQYKRYSYLNISENTIGYHIIRKLLSTSRYLSVEYFMDQLYCSRSTIVRILDKVKKYLENYHLEIKNKKNYGLQINGSEWDKRLCLIKMEKIKRHDQNTYDDESGFDAMFLLNTNQRSEVRKAVVSYFSHCPSFSLSQLDLPEIYNMIILNHTRKQYLKDDEPVLQITDIHTLNISHSICSLLSEELKNSCGDNEIKMLAILIDSLALPTKDFLRENNLLSNYIEQGHEIESYIRKYFDLPFAFDDMFYDNMASFLFRLEQQLIYGKAEDREYITSSFNRGIVSADMCCCLGLWYYDRTGLLLTDSMLSQAYYIINREANINRRFYAPKRIAVMSRNGLFYAENIAERVKAQYSEYIKTVTCVDFCQLETYDWSDNDLLFSDLFLNLLPPTKHSVINVPFGSLHDQNLFVHLDEYFQQLIRLDALELFPKKNLRHCFAENMDEIYDELYEVYSGQETDKDTLIKDVRLHEQMVGSKRNNGIISMSTCALRTKEAFFSLILTQKSMIYDDMPCSVFVFYSYGDGSMKNRYLISWLIERLYGKKEDWLNSLFQKDYQSITEEL